jgi:hypothetical protein
MTPLARNTMKAYRDRTHATPPEALREQRKRQAVETGKILGALKAGPRTVPEITKETGLPSQLVVWYVMTFCKDKTVHIAEKLCDGYYRYELTAKGGR